MKSSWLRSKIVPGAEELTFLRNLYWENQYRPKLYIKIAKITEIFMEIVYEALNIAWLESLLN
jgi:hypothetical protein